MTRLCGAPNPYPINGTCIKVAGHDAPENDLETKLHTNGSSRWSCEDLARQAELAEQDTMRPTGGFDAAEALRLRVEATADRVLTIVPPALADMVARAEAERRARADTRPPMRRTSTRPHFGQRDGAA